MEWQKVIFKRGIKKRQKLNKILNFIDEIPQIGVIIGCETGVIGNFMEGLGGKWIHCDRDEVILNTSKDILKGLLLKINENYLPFKEKAFELVVIPDFLEHIKEDSKFLIEVRRAIKDGGNIVITVPHYKKNSLLRRLKNLIGMKDEIYGHVRPGYKINEIKELIRNSGFEIERMEFYSGSFTEIVELLLNIGFVLSGRKKESYKGNISPLREEDINSRKFLFRVHGIIHPLLKAFSFLDKSLFFQRGYVIALKARKK